jgi:hypothetical protein
VRARENRSGNVLQIDHLCEVVHTDFIESCAVTGGEVVATFANGLRHPHAVTAADAGTIVSACQPASAPRRIVLRGLVIAGTMRAT